MRNVSILRISILRISISDFMLVTKIKIILKWYDLMES